LQRFRNDPALRALLLIGALAGMARTEAMSAEYTLFLFSSPAKGLEQGYESHFVTDTARALLTLPEVRSVQQFRILQRHLVLGAKPYADVMQVLLRSDDLATTMRKLGSLRDADALFTQRYLADVVRSGVYYGEGTFVPLGPARVAVGRDVEPDAHHYVVMFFTNAAPGKLAAFNRWYDRQEIAALLSIKGVLSAQRFTLAAEQLRDPRREHRYQYSVRLELATTDINRTLDEFQSAFQAGRILTNPALSRDFSDGVFEPASETFSHAHQP
jgi:hypothetical protein